jgi:membrane-associated phospholipid phosphatase
LNPDSNNPGELTARKDGEGIAFTAWLSTARLKPHLQPSDLIETLAIDPYKQALHPDASLVPRLPSALDPADDGSTTRHTPLLIAAMIPALGEGIPLLTWRWLTPFGDALLIVPLVVAAAILLAWHDRKARLPALGWVAMMVLACGLVAASKVAFYGWGTGVRAWDMTCFSGHAVLAFSCWPVLLGLLNTPKALVRRRIMATVGAAFALLVGYSRVRTGAHPLSEVIAGAVLGSLLAIASLRLLAGCTLALGKKAIFIPIACVAVLWAMQQQIRLPSEHVMARIGAHLADRDQPVSRVAWRQHAEAPAAD